MICPVCTIEMPWSMPSVWVYNAERICHPCAAWAGGFRRTLFGCRACAGITINVDKVCARCKREGRVAKCWHCDGSGKQDMGHPSRDCRQCEGSGRIQT